MKTVAPWTWPELSREDLNRAEMLRKADGIAKFDLAGAEYRLRFPKAFATPFQPTVETAVDVGGMRILIESESIPRIEPMYSLLEGLEDGDLPAEALGAVLESSLAAVLAGAEKALGSPMVIERVGPIGGTPWSEETSAVEILLEPIAEGEPVRLRIRIEDLALETLLGRMVPAQTGTVPEMGHVPVLVTFTAAELKLRSGEFAELECGDVILLDADPRRKKGITVRAGMAARACALASWEGKDLILEEAMAMEGKKDGTQETAGKRSLEEMDIEVAFELGRRLITLRELGEITAGHVFMLPDNPDGKVEIRINGSLIGKGTLVKVSGHAGIRVESLRGSATEQEGNSDVTEAVEEAILESQAAAPESTLKEEAPGEPGHGESAAEALVAQGDAHGEANGHP